MVHALNESWRVLTPGGMLVDLRPISMDVPILVLTEGGWLPAGFPDHSPDRVHDLACDQALRQVVREGRFSLRKRRYFDAHNYWNSVEDLRDEINERWKDDILVTEDTWEQARRLFAQGRGENRVQMAFRKKMCAYQKV